MTARVLIVDDDPSLPRTLARILSAHGYAVSVVPSGEQAVEAMAASPFDVALLDVSLLGMTGLETFTALRTTHPSLIGIFMTAFGSIRSAVQAMRAGGFDYLTKPFDNDELLLALERALDIRRLGEEVRLLREEIGSRVAFPGIVGRSPKMLEVLRLLPRAAASAATVLVLGESGTGKELIARSLHRGSEHPSGPFVAVNCSAIPIDLFETEFFGHEPGAFTGARGRRIGRFEQAHGGTLFLDEIGDLPLEAQAKLLRVLEDGQVVRLGGRNPVTVEVRVVAATNKDLGAEVAARRFRQDLFWRINVVPIDLPPLRERQDDLPLLVQHFVDRLNAEVGRRMRGLTPEAMARLEAHEWPGNIRELENTLRRAFVLADGDLVTAADLMIVAGASATGGSGAGVAGAWAGGERAGSLADVLARTAARIERDLIESTLARFRGNRGATAEALGIHRKTLFNKIRQYDLREFDESLDEE
ncbi:MAG TPA: sigma-54 dependent transcriptional regulator [Vicinamibacterales bacterium]|nr:sigma-54 dependent transcriptional regulator [Vicinamibacterales bacterium]